MPLILCEISKVLTSVTMKVRIQCKFFYEFLKRFAYFIYPHVKSSAVNCCDVLLANDIINVAII
jgi:hypothetical protein